MAMRSAGKPARDAADSHASKLSPTAMICWPSADQASHLPANAARHHPCPAGAPALILGFPDAFDLGISDTPQFH